MLEALVAGSTDPGELAELARGWLRDKLPQLQQALTGCFGAHQRFLVAQQLAHIDFLDERIGKVGAQIAERLRPFEPELEGRDTVPGVARRVLVALPGESLPAG